MDRALLDLRNRIIALVEAAPSDSGVNALGYHDLSPYYDMEYTDELDEALDDLEVRIRDAAISHGVDVQVPSVK
jgi:hypothetical protein